MNFDVQQIVGLAFLVGYLVLGLVCVIHVWRVKKRGKLHYWRRTSAERG